MRRWNVTVAVMVGVLALAVGVLAWLHDERECASRGGKLHCTSSTGWSTDGHAVTLTNCNCYTQDGRLIP
jgi:uncharacterized membrane protein